MDDLFNLLSSSARLNKSKRKRKQPPTATHRSQLSNEDDLSPQSQMSAFRRSMQIKVESDGDISDAVSTFTDIAQPSWWSTSSLFSQMRSSLLKNIEAGAWKEPTAIQMQTIPSLLQRQDVAASAPTGSGKSGAFIIPALMLACPTNEEYFNANNDSKKKKASSKSKSKSKKSQEKESCQGHIRVLILAPSRELASQLHREVERLGKNKPGGLTSLLLARSNQATASQAGGKKGLDSMVTTPLRLVDALKEGNISLDHTRVVILDEADRLLDSSGDSSFLSQMDTVLQHTPATATRALFSATMTPAVRQLCSTILRHGLHIAVQSGSGVNKSIGQELLFVGKEQGKLLAIRQLVARGDLKPPCIIFVQSQERAQALFAELLYDKIHVDVLHAGRSQAARENAVKKFRKGNTWVLICTDLMARGVDFLSVNMVINYDLPTSGVSYVHRIGRTARGGREGKAITFFTEADFENLRAIANVMKQSGCDVPDWMLKLKKKKKQRALPKRHNIDTTPGYDKTKRHKKMQSIKHSKKEAISTRQVAK